MSITDVFQWIIAVCNVTLACVALKMLQTQRDWHPIQRWRTDRLRDKLNGCVDRSDGT